MIAHPWRLSVQRLKNYPHFDAPLSIEAAEALANDRVRVARHNFYPFLQFERRWTRYAEKGHKGKVKTRKISYACRADAYIFAKYREDLSAIYEEDLVSAGLSESIIAYRRILNPSTMSGKCNIDFAKDAFDAVKAFGNCYALTLDISAYFDSIDHGILKDVWCRTLGVKRLPADHFAVFKAVTQFATVDARSAFERLGHFGAKYKAPDGTIIKGYLTPAKLMPKQLCTGKVFREVIAGGDKQPSLVFRNPNSYGIPQGSTISDLLANAYLLSFDVGVKNIADSLAGVYFRYSDDLILIAPCSESEIREAAAHIEGLIRENGPQLVIKPEKSTLHKFSNAPPAQTCTRVSGSSAANGLEYLGFRFDGQHVYLRDSTISNCKRKILRAARFKARGHVANLKHLPPSQIVASINRSEFVQRFGRVEDFYQVADRYTSWTFWTYAKRAAKIFGSDGTKILRQLRGYKRYCIKVLETAIEEEIREPTHPYPRIVSASPVAAPSS